MLWDFRSGPVPTLVVLEKLSESGWQRVFDGDKPVQHTLDDIQKRVCFSKDAPLANKPYLRCLLCLPDLLSDQYIALPAGQKQSYYTAVLKSKAPETILLGQPVQYYKKLMDDGQPVEEPFDLEDELSPERDAVEDDVDELSLFCDSLGIPKSGRVQPSEPRRKKRMTETDGGRDWVEDVMWLGAFDV